MRLKSIKLAGFKSFVDPTTIAFPRNLSAVVGPNGCGKSNVIDAVRWVMGESSAKQLRGESLDDVIFNGSAMRKPVGQAAIELSFDNSDGTLTGQYAGYNEIAIRREITRDGQSSYFLNSTRCRRRDIIDIFLGTGLGPRSYAIIEQGMISRLVDAKPDDLRGYLEEAATISKYKERKHETEIRINHTQENLNRLNDVREELEKQLNHLQRQANAAERYKVLKQEERSIRAQIQGLRYRTLNAQLQEQVSEIAQYQSQLDEALAVQQKIENELEQQRNTQSETTAQSSEAQAQYYQICSEVAQLEQRIQHQTELCAQWRNEQQELERNKILLEQQFNEVEQQQSDLVAQTTTLEPEIEQAQQKSSESQQILLQAEQTLHNWQLEWEKFNQQSAEADQQVNIQQTRIQHLTQRLQTIEQRLSRLQQEHEQQSGLLNETPGADLEQQAVGLQQQREECEYKLQAVRSEITAQREQNAKLQASLDASKSNLQTLQGQLASIEALQQAALGQNEELIVDWLSEQQLADNQRLAQTLQVEAGWEQAVETVLERHLQAICIDELSVVEQHLNHLPQGNLTFIAKSDAALHPSTTREYPSLLSKITASWPLNSLLSGIYVAETLEEALRMAVQLSASESVITRQGVWLGNNWMLVAHKADVTTGVLKRERELQELKLALSAAAEFVQKEQTQLTEGRDRLLYLENQADAESELLSETIAKQAELNTQLQVLKTRFDHACARAEQLNTEIQDCTEQLANDQKMLAQAQTVLQEATQHLEQHTRQREQLLSQKIQYQTEQDEARKQANTDKEMAHQLALRLQAAQLQLNTAQQNQQRLQQQLKQLHERQELLQKNTAENEQPLVELKQHLQSLAARRVEAEQTMKSRQQQAETLDQALRQMEKQRHEIEQKVGNARNALEQIRLSGQALDVRCKSLQEQIQESGYELENLLNEIAEDAQENICEEQLQQIMRKIDRLGPINLAAIDEFTTLSERKTYLDTQFNDLTDALATLNDAISKIDRETRSRFKDTFDQVNSNFQAIFPRLFGGGKASLELIGDELLSAGITIMAQPPGKRNSTIHLLSGGEKALTAIALVFSLFQLTPAPFCMLDEVDAPLDDANVVRFCNLVKEMSEKVQFIFISHNKLAIEMAEQLAGVTMHEAGVSRLVAVDVEEAIALAGA